MARLTINISQQRQRALKEAAARRGKTMGELVEESLEFYGIKTADNALDLLQRTRARAGLSDETAEALGMEAARDVRKHRR